MSAQAQSAFDKGLRANPSEQLATISQLSRLFEENPSPTFVNAILLRVADAFKDGTLDLRVGISRALRQCGSHLTLAFSSAEIFRRILTVSHSNDPSARENVLDVLAVLSSLLPESNQSHHLIRESLSTSHEGEFRAACNALKAFASISQPFAETIVLQIGKILEEDDASEARKILLCSAFSTMSATAYVVEQVFGIADTVLRRTTSEEYFYAFLEATTSLCIETRYSIPKQIDLLLHLLNPSEKDKRKHSKGKKLIVIKELKRLSTFSNMWTEKQVRSFVSTLSPTLPDRSLSDFFDACVSLVKNCPRGNLMALKQLVISSNGFGSYSNPEVSVRFIHLAAQVVCNPLTFEGETAQFVETTMTSLTVVLVGTCTCGKLKKQLAGRLYRSVGDILIAFPFFHTTFSPMIISAVFSAFDSTVFDDNNQKERLEMLCRLADSEKMYVVEIHSWACGIMKNKKELFNAHPNQFAYLCLAVGTKLPDDASGVLYPDSPLLKYETARTALRNGHWKGVASPNLSSINLQKLPSVERDWLTALRELADSQLSEFTLDELAAQQSHLTNALSIMKTASGNKGMDKTMQFPIGMVSAMLSTSHAFFHLLSVIRPFSMFLSGALQPNQFFNPTVAKRFVAALAPCEATFDEALADWSALCRTSFCADSTSFDLITLYYMKVSIMLVAVKVILKKQAADTVIQIPPLSFNRTCCLMQRERLEWVISKIPSLRYDHVLNIKTINILHLLAEQLVIMPYMLPRFFFQQFYHVDFKITTTPQIEKDKPIIVGPNETIPIRVDGAMTSSHPSSIRSIIVYAEVSYHNNHAQNHTLKEIVEPSENNYFTAQFLQSFRAPCDIKIRIEFVDQTSRKQWQANGGTTIPIAVRELPQTIPAEKRSQAPPAFLRSSIF